MVQLSPRKCPSRMRSYMPGCSESTCIVASPVLRRGQPDGGESCIVLESGPTHSLIANLPKRSSLVICVNFVLQAENAANKAMDGYVRNLDAGCHGV